MYCRIVLCADVFRAQRTRVEQTLWPQPKFLVWYKVLPVYEADLRRPPPSVCVRVSHGASERPLAHFKPLFGTADLSSSPSSIPFTGYSTSLTRATDEPEKILVRTPPPHRPITQFPWHNRKKPSTSQSILNDWGCLNFASPLNKATLWR